MEFHLIHFGMIFVSLPLTLGSIGTFNPRVPLPKTTCQNLNFMPKLKPCQSCMYHLKVRNVSLCALKERVTRPPSFHLADIFR